MIYIDYDPDRFEALLDYIRTGSRPIKEVKRFESDLEFFGPFEKDERENTPPPKPVMRERMKRSPVGRKPRAKLYDPPSMFRKS